MTKQRLPEDLQDYLIAMNKVLNNFDRRLKILEDDLIKRQEEKEKEEEEESKE